MNLMDETSKSKNLCWILVKNRLIAQSGINILRYEKDKKKRNSKIAVFVAIIICLITIISYSGGIAYGYAYLEMTELIPGIALIMGSLITLFFTMFKANGELFAFKDYDMVMSLPIPIRTIINSRFLNMYLWNTLFSLLVMLPMGIIFGYFIKPSLIFYIMWIIGAFLACLIPTTVAAIFGAVITAISTKFKYANIASTIFSMVLLVVFMLFSMTSTGDNGLGKFINSETGNMDVEALSSLAPIISDSMDQIYPMTKLFTEGIVNGNISSFLLFAAISIGGYVLFVFLLSLRYRQINTALTSHGSRGDYKMTTLHQSSMRTALYKKTILRILKSTVCATNLLVGCVLAVLFAVAMFITGPEKVLGSLDLLEYMGFIKGAAGYVIAAMVSMTNTAAISLALEGKSIGLIKSLPVPPKILYDSYILTNLTFTIPTSIICSILFGVSLEMGFVGMILMLLTTITFSLFTSVMGIFVGNRMAYYDWQEETSLIKQSLMSLIGMLGGAVFIFICGVIANIRIFSISTYGITFILDILILILTAVIYINESTRLIKE